MTFKEFVDYLKEDKYASESLVILRFGKQSDEYQVIRAILNDTWSKVNKFAKKRQEKAWDNIVQFFSQDHRATLSCRYYILRAIHDHYEVLGPFFITKLDLLDAVFENIEGEKDYPFLDEILEYCAEQGWLKYTELKDNNLSIDYVVDPNINWPK